MVDETLKIDSVGGKAKEEENVRPFKCIFCPKAYSSRDSLKRHILDHVGETSFLCSTCGKGFTRRAALLAHMNRHEQTTGTGNGNMFQCDKCPMRLRSMTSLKTHMQRHQKKPEQQCAVCGEFIAGNASMKTHLLNHEERKFQCPLCPRVFARQSDVKWHSLVHKNADKQHCCHVCQRRFTTVEYMELHMRVHEGLTPFICSVCGKSFTKKQHLQYHLRLHTGEKPHKCDVCGRCFRVVTNLNLHMMDHTGDLPFHCTTCFKKFKRKDLLERHQLTHLSAEQRAAQGWQSTNPRNHKTTPLLTLKQVVAVLEEQDKRGDEEGDRQFVLDVLSSTRLADEMPQLCRFPCLKCPKTFSSAIYLEKHMLVEHVEQPKVSDVTSTSKPYSCSLCSKSYTRLQSLKTHQETHQPASPHPVTTFPYSQPFKPSRHFLRKYRTTKCEVGESVDDDATNMPQPEEARETVAAEIVGATCEPQQRESPETGAPVTAGKAGKPKSSRYLLRKQWSTKRKLETSPSATQAVLMTSKPQPGEFFISPDCRADETLTTSTTRSSRYSFRKQCNTKRKPGTSPDADETQTTSNPQPDGDQTVGTSAGPSEPGSLPEAHTTIKESYRVGYRCPTCPKRFISRSYWKTHMRMHDKDCDLPRCSLCNKICRNAAALSNHEQTHERKKNHPYHCNFCSNAYSSRQYMISHLKVHLSGEMISCPECGKTFVHTTHLWAHRKREHNVFRRQCHMCPKSFPTIDKLNRHLAWHSRSFTCDMCLKPFKRKKLLLIHLTSHLSSLNVDDSAKVTENVIKTRRESISEEIKPSESSESPAEDPVWAVLRDEEEGNSNTPIVIEIKEEYDAAAEGDSWSGVDSHENGNSFIIDPNLKNESLNDYELKTEPVKEEHITESNECGTNLRGKRSWLRRQAKVCPICDVTLLGEMTMELHLLLHRGETPWACDLCSRQVGSKKSLKAHIQRHLARRVVCPCCGVQFANRLLMADHQQHQQPFVCELCGETFPHHIKCPRCTVDPPSGQGCDMCDHQTSEATAGQYLKAHQGGLSHICDQCGRKFLCKSQLKIHYITHGSDKKFRCSHENCHKSFKSEKYLELHEKAHAGYKPHQCQECGKGFLRPQQLKQHMVLHATASGDTTNQCPVCLRCLTSPYYLKRHIANHDGYRPYACRICKRQFSTKNNMKRHLLNHEGEEGYEEAIQLDLKEPSKKPSNYLCNVCGKELPNLMKLKWHVNRHTGIMPHSCTICNKGFNTKRELWKHGRAHSDEKTQCPFCEKSYKDPGFLKNHILSHTEPQTSHHYCQACNKGFPKKSSLKCHMLVHTNDYRFKCKRCPRGFSRKDRLEEHEAIHAAVDVGGPLPYACKVCDKTFKTKQYRMQHQLTHDPNPPFSCQHCGKVMATAGHLATHMLRHSNGGMRSYSCGICGRGFASAATLRVHKQLQRHDHSVKYIRSGGPTLNTSTPVVAT